MKYDTIGVGYDTTRRPDPRLADRILALLEPVTDARYLDVACGTGNYTHLLQARGLNLVGVDESTTMLNAARAKYPAIAWLQADVAELPFGDGSFDGAICTQAIHHFPDLPGALSEIARILRAGRLVILTARREQMRHYWLNAYFPKAMRRAINQLPSDRQLQAAIDRAKLRIVVTEPWSVPCDPIDLFLYSGKHNPSLYLDAQVRQGISTFANLAEANEVETGLACLQRDIATGTIAQVMARYASVEGDYLFLVAQRADCARAAADSS